MHQRRIPEWLRHAPAPSVRGFATLAGTEAMARGILISVMPLEMYRALRDAALVSEVYFLVGILSLVTGLMVPFVSRFMPRRWIYVMGCAMFAGGATLGAQGGALGMIGALALITAATVTVFVCFNAYVLDFIAKTELGRCETSRMFYSALGWTVGPWLGVTLLGVWRPLPFMIAGVAALTMMVLFLYMRLGNGRLITRARRPAPNPLAWMPRFFAQPRLVAGWIFAVIRSCGWWAYVVYLPIFALEQGLGEDLGGMLLSVSNGMLFLTPLMLRWMQRRSIRHAVRAGFLMSGLLFVFGAALSGLPWVTVACLACASVFLVLLDVSAGLPFLMAVKPSERTEMSAIYASFRDVSGILTPGAAWLVLLIAPLPGIFVVSGVGLMGCWHLARRLHPRLGAVRVAMEQGPSLNIPLPLSQKTG
ncbi:MULTISPECIES: MFS transporter [unclassified Roseovarius]|uniref:MFS transporter n=1 Tax=unclassified Roseovarius TaxID=2614913 RepID=UPI0000685A3E|nr:MULTISPECIES: MFS transporter [unclassified Roseovarius]EAQ27106.1 membrane protein, putative [Roseovarius sp. 217]KJS43842.1 MAG: MFS transporter [Roseovarius sp. BRH_c41]